MKIEGKLLLKPEEFKPSFSNWKIVGILNPGVIRAKNKNIRAGKGTMRGRKYKIKKSPLIVIANEKGLEKGARNLPGVDVVNAMNLSVEHLAPGARYGRLTVYTKNAISKLKERFI